jgi:hypothetical protein
MRSAGALRLFNAVLGRTQTTVINFSMDRARDRAWAVAQDLAPLSREGQETAIARLDRDVADFARVMPPGRRPRRDDNARPGGRAGLDRPQDRDPVLSAAPLAPIRHIRAARTTRPPRQMG